MRPVAEKTTITGEEFRVLKQRMGMTSEQLAKWAGYHYTTVKGWCRTRGPRPPQFLIDEMRDYIAKKEAETSA